MQNGTCGGATDPTVVFTSVLHGQVKIDRFRHFRVDRMPWILITCYTQELIPKNPTSC